MPARESVPSREEERVISPTPARDRKAPAVCMGRSRARVSSASAPRVSTGMAARISDALTVEVRWMPLYSQK